MAQMVVRNVITRLYGAERYSLARVFITVGLWFFGMGFRKPESKRAGLGGARSLAMRHKLDGYLTRPSVARWVGPLQGGGTVGVSV